MSTPTPTYATEADVYEETGLTSELIQRVTEKTSAEVTTMINSFLFKAEADIKDQLCLPHVVAFELHLGTGEDDEFQLGPDDEPFHMEYSPENCVESVEQCYFDGKRKKRPYPTDGDLIETASNWDSTGYTLPTKDTTIRTYGSMKFDWHLAAGTARYPNVTNGNYIDKNIDIFDYMFFRVRSTVANVTVTIRLYNEAGSYNEATYTIITANKWYLVMLHLDDNFTSTLDWDDNPLYWFTITVNKACYLYMYNLNFNDGYCFTTPEGKLVIMRKLDDEPAGEGYEFLVTYTYDPFKVTTPDNINRACAQIAGASLIQHLIGVRDAYMAVEADTIEVVPEKEQLYITKTSLLARAKENLASYGFGWSGTAVP